jgi:hypothetical protein
VRALAHVAGFELPVPRGLVDTLEEPPLLLVVQVAGVGRVDLPDSKALPLTTRKVSST